MVVELAISFRILPTKGSLLRYDLDNTFALICCDLSMQNTSLAIACSDACDSWVGAEGNGTCSDPRKGLVGRYRREGKDYRLPGQRVAGFKLFRALLSRADAKLLTTGLAA